jgi:Gpi18-like mannosyltransferase
LWTSVLFLGWAFAFKMQALMLLPFFFVMMLKKQIKFYHFLLIPIVYFINILPVFLMGRPLSGLLSIHISQSPHYKFINMNFPNLYIWISNDYYETVKNIGLCVVFLITLITGIMLSKKPFEFTFEHWIQ